jgi:hypothetical protein
MAARHHPPGLPAPLTVHTVTVQQTTGIARARDVIGTSSPSDRLPTAPVHASEDLVGALCRLAAKRLMAIGPWTLGAYCSTYMERGIC